MKPGSFKFCLVLSLLCHLAGFAAYQFFVSSGVASKPAPISVPLVVYSQTPVPVNISATPKLKPATPVPNKKLDKLFSAESFAPLKPIVVSPKKQTSVGEKQFAALARGQTAAVKTSPLADASSNSVIVGTRISRVFAMANIQPEYYKNPRPEYPESARRARQEGIVWLRVHITEHGKPDRVAVAQSSGFEALDAAAVEAVRGWEFTPAQLGEVFVESEIDFPIQFRLD